MCAFYLQYIGILSKIFSSSPSKDIETFSTKDLRCLAICRIQLVTTGNPVNSYLTSTVDKTHHGQVIALFLSYAGGVLITNYFYCH